jgi:hypothetical protein
MPAPRKGRPGFERVRLALESGDLDAIRDLLDPGARWGAPEGPHDADCQNQVRCVPEGCGRWRSGPDCSGPVKLSQEGQYLGADLGRMAHVRGVRAAFDDREPRGTAQSAAQFLGLG